MINRTLKREQYREGERKSKWFIYMYVYYSVSGIISFFLGLFESIWWWLINEIIIFLFSSKHPMDI